MSLLVYYDDEENMNKKVSTAIISIACLGLVGATTVGVLYKNGIITSDNLYTTQNVPSQGKVIKNGSSAANSTVQTKHKNCTDALLKQGAKYTLQHAEDETVADTKFCDMTFKVNSIAVTKKRGNFDQCEDWKEKKDSAGNLTNGYSYVVVNLTILDKCTKNHMYGLNDNDLVIDKNGDGGELRAYNGKERDVREKQYFILSLKPNQTYNFNLVYIIKDDELKKHKNEIMLHCNSGDSSRRPPSPEELPVVDSKGNITKLKE
jgi:hypothetical protein